MRADLPPGRWIELGRRLSEAAALAFCAIGLAPTAASAADLHATPSTFGSVFASAKAGDTVSLASGSYGTFAGAMKTGLVTIKPEVGATPTMAVSFNPAAFIRIDGLQLGDVTLAGARTHDITIANSNVTGQTILRTGQLANANVLLDHNVHANWDTCGGCNEARVWLPDRTAQPSGITIQNSQFGPGGLSDGIQNGSNGTKIVNNVFFGLTAGSVSGVHTDAIQLYGSQNTLIRGNYFHDVPDAIMAPDGTDHETIEHNVFAAGDEYDYPYAITLWADKGSVISHNTMLYAGCAFNLKCGYISLGSKSGSATSTGTVVRDNIFTGVACCGDVNSAGYASDHNLTRTNVNGTANLNAAPTFAGGTHPTTFAGFALTASSPGRGTASDGTNRGADVVTIAAGGVPGGPSTGATVPPAPAPVVPPAPALPSLGPSTPPGGVGAGPFGTALVAAFGFDQVKAEIAADTSGNRHTAPLSGARFTPVAHSGRALSFHGGRSAVVVRGSAALRLRKGVTLEAWARPTGARHAWRPVVSLGPSGRVLTLFGSDAGGRPAATASGAPRSARGAAALRRVGWTHLALTYDGRRLKLYVNGRVTRTRTRAGLLPMRGPVRIGADTHGRSFRGQIDDLRVYAAALDAAAIQHDMATPVRATG